MRFLALALLCAFVLRVQAVEPPVAPQAEERWAESFARFDEADRQRPPAPGGVLFVGSSSIRLWSGLESSFEGWPLVLKRGFGGSRLEDCQRHLERLVLRYRPKLVFVYAGENDLAEGRRPQEVLESFQAFVEGVRGALPGTRIVYLSIKPSPLRAGLMPQVRETNRLIERYIAGRPQLDFIDLHTPMLGADGRARPELFGPDGLHLNEQGYRLWQELIAAHRQL